MAPPSPRRPGFSRRAQYGIFASYVIAVIGAALALLFALTARLDPQGHSALQGMFSDITAPVSSVGRAAINSVKNATSETAAYFNAASKNREMAEELKTTRLKLIQGQADALENKRLKFLLGIAQNGDKGVVAARLIASTGTSSRRFATFGAGSNSKVLNGQAIRAPEGLVGRIVQVNRNTARVLLIVDGGNVVPVKRVRDNVPALAIGIGDGRIDLKPLAAGTNPFRVGDIFVTSGSGGIYQPGIPVAVGVRHDREGTIARPLADPSKLDFALAIPVFVADAVAAQDTVPTPERGE